MKLNIGRIPSKKVDVGARSSSSSPSRPGNFATPASASRIHPHHNTTNPSPQVLSLLPALRFHYDKKHTVEQRTREIPETPSPQKKKEEQASRGSISSSKKRPVCRNPTQTQVFRPCWCPHERIASKSRGIIIAHTPPIADSGFGGGARGRERMTVGSQSPCPIVVRPAGPARAPHSH